MKVNSIKQFISDIEEILGSLALLTGDTACIRWSGNHVYHYMSCKRIGVNFKVNFNANIDFNNCAEWWLRSLFCHLAHGDQCGSSKYLLLKKKTKKAYTDILTCFKKSNFLEPLENSMFEINRRHIRLYFDFSRIEISETQLSPQLLLVKKDILHKCSEGDHNRNRPELFAKYTELLSNELGIEFNNERSFVCY